MGLKDKIDKKLSEITFLGAFSGFLTLLVTVMFCVVFTYFGITHKSLQKEWQQTMLDNQEVKSKVEEVEKRSEKEWNLWNKKGNTDFVFPLEFREKNNDFVINYNAEYNENISQINTNISGFPLGEYNFSRIPVGEMVLKNAANRINDFLLIHSNAKINITVIGTSDDSKPNSNAKYNGDLGDTINIPYYNKDDTTKSLTRTIYKNQQMTNTEYALLRAYSVVKYFNDNVSCDIGKDNIKIYVKLYKQKGAEYRRCDFSITLKDYFTIQKD
jgi:hypothetical protein